MQGPPSDSSASADRDRKRTRHREAIARRDWDLSAIFRDGTAWRDELDALRTEVESFPREPLELEGDPGRLANILDRLFDFDRRTNLLHTWAALRSDEDVSQPEPREMRQAVEALASEITTRTSWVEPTILEIPASTLASMRAAEPRLAVYHRFLEQLERRRPHVLTRECEELLGRVHLIRGTGATIAGLLRDAEMPWEEIVLSDGTSLRADQNGLAKIRILPNREDRERGYRAFFGRLAEFSGSLGAAVYGTVKEHVFAARARRYRDALEASLDPNEIPTRVYEMLVEETRRALPTLHRSFDLRRRCLGLDRLAYHDLHVPLVPSIQLEPTWDEARDVVLAALAPLGEDYVADLEQALVGGWVHVDPAPGKRSGAYVNDGAYGVHPYMLLNHQNDYHSLSTLAHESGHLMHSLYSQREHPYPTAHYRIFVAEVASTVNEVLLVHYLLDRADGPRSRLGLLGHLLDGLRGSVFRQTMFAEFELEIHRLVERGEALTGESLGRHYLELLRRYHGVDDGVVEVDPLYAVEWAYVPHFHYNFYVYQYATSFIAAMDLAERLRSGDPRARQAFRRFLARGSAAPSVELLRDAGVDMTQPTPFRSTIARMEAIIGTVERLLDEPA